MRAMSKESATSPTSGEGKQYHIDCSSGDLARYVLLPGDPDRVPLIGSFWDSYEEVSYHREFRSARGTYKGVDISACSTGIGPASTEIAISELATIGCDTFIRVGTTGAIREDIRCGDLIINVASARLEGTTDDYVSKGYPAFANYEVSLALIEACERSGFSYHTGISASASSFYCGQARPGFGGYWQSRLDNLIPDLAKAGIINFEMEGSVAFVLSTLFGCRAGMICVAIANRITDEWRTEGAQEILSQAGCEAIKILAEWDKIKERSGKRYLYPSLLLGE